MKLVTLKKRSDFLRLAASGHKVVRSGFLLQAAQSPYHEENTIHLGFTATKKLGNAVIRNRVKRRLRALAQDLFAEHAREGVDYVLIGRKNTVHSPYDALCRDLKSALAQIHKELKCDS